MGNCIDYLANFISTTQSPLYIQDLVNVLAEPGPHYVFIKNKNGRYEYANQPFIELMGLKNLSDLFGQSDGMLCADKGKVKQYLDDDCYVLENASVCPLLEEVIPRYNPLLIRTMKGSLYPLWKNADNPNYVLGIVSSLTKITKLDWDTLFTLNHFELAELLVKKRYLISTQWGDIHFSKREIQLIVELLRGSHAGIIAKHLCLKQSTVESYLVNIKNKLGVSNKSELISFVISSKFLHQIIL